MKVFFYTLFCSILFFSCTKHKGDEAAIEVPKASITFHSPVVGGVYPLGDSLSIKATAISTETIHGYDLAVYKAGNTSAIYFKNIHEHNDTLLVDQKWKGEAAGTMEAELTLYLDHDGHTLKRKVAFAMQ